MLKFVRQQGEQLLVRPRRAKADPQADHSVRGHPDAIHEGAVQGPRQRRAPAENQEPSSCVQFSDQLAECRRPVMADLGELPQVRLPSQDGRQRPGLQRAVRGARQAEQGGGNAQGCYQHAPHPAPAKTIVQRAKEGICAAPRLAVLCRPLRHAAAPHAALESGAMQPDARSAGVRDDGDRLDSWKEIAAYLRRDVTTVQRWERREGLPVHRLVHARQGSVYAFKHELDAWVHSRDGSAISESARAAPSTAASESDEVVGPGVSRRPRLSFAVVLTALILGAGVLAFLTVPLLRRESGAGPTADSQPPRGTPPVGGIPAGPIGVATLENQTGDTSLDGIGRLAAERVIRLLAQGTQLEVLPRPLESAAATSGPGESGRAPSLLVAGAYYRREPTLEFQVRILDAASGRLLHGVAPIVEPPARIADALDRLEQKVAGAVAIHFDDFFGGLQIVAHPPTLNAYREYRAGLEVFQSDYRRSLGHLERALELDPDFLLPLVIMEFVYYNLGEEKQSERVLARMEGQADRSTAAEKLWIEFARASLEGRRPQALRVLLDLERAVPASFLVNFNILQQAVALNRPTLAVQTFEKIPTFGRSLRHSIGTYRTIPITAAFHLLGAYDRELQEARRAQEYAPGVHLLLAVEARALAAQGRVADVIRVIERSLATGPTLGLTRSAGFVMEEAAAELRAHGHRDVSLQVAARAVEWFERRPPDIRSSRENRAALAGALYLSERWVDARRVYSALLAEYPDAANYTAHVGQLAARTGDLVEARAISERLARVPAAGLLGRESRAWAMFERARIAALLGDKQQAVDLLRDAITEGLPVNLNIHNNPDFEPLRDYSPFVALTRSSD